MLPKGRPIGIPLLDMINLASALKAMGVTVLDDAAAGLPVPQSVVPPFAIIHGGVSNVGANTYMSNPKETINIELRSKKKATEMRAKPAIFLVAGRIDALICSFGPVIEIAGPGRKTEHAEVQQADLRSLLRE